MSYASGAALQAAIYEALTGDAALRAIVGAAIHDAEPDAPPDLYVALGPERARGRSDATGSGAEHLLRVSAVTTRAGFASAKAAAARISEVLDGARLTLGRGRLASLRFHDARALRDRGARTRRVDLTFRARTDHTHEGSTP